MAATLTNTFLLSDSSSKSNPAFTHDVLAPSELFISELATHFLAHLVSGLMASPGTHSFVQLKKAAGKEVLAEPQDALVMLVMLSYTVGAPSPRRMGSWPLLCHWLEGAPEGTLSSGHCGRQNKVSLAPHPQRCAEMSGS